MKKSELRKIIREEIKAVKSPFSSDSSISQADTYSDSNTSSPDLELNDLEQKLNEFWDGYPEFKGMSPDDILYLSIEEWDYGIWDLAIDFFEDYLDFDSALTFSIKNKFVNGVIWILKYINPTQKHLSLAKDMVKTSLDKNKTQEIYDFLLKKTKGSSPKKNKFGLWKKK